MTRAALFVVCTLLSTKLLSGQIVVTARLVLEDGSPFTTSPLISLRVPGAEAICSKQEFFMGGTLRLGFAPVRIRGELQQGCEISIILPGYRTFTGYVEDGTLITMHREGPNEGSSVSAISLNAPPDARKEYESGEALASKKKWNQAEMHFRKSVALYPKYALAWSELGQALRDQGRLNEAIDAFQKAHELDPVYIKPLVQLASASSSQQNWKDELRFSEEALKSHPVDFPDAYYYHAEATFHLGNVDEAEKFTREGIQLDLAGNYPDALFLLANIFEKQGQLEYASIQYKNYLKAASHGAHAAEAKEAITRLKH